MYFGGVGFSAMEKEQLPARYLYCAPGQGEREREREWEAREIFRDSGSFVSHIRGLSYMTFVEKMGENQEVVQILGQRYRVSQHIVQNLPLTLVQKFRFGMACPGTFVFKSTGGFKQCAVTPCKSLQRERGVEGQKVPKYCGRHLWKPPSHATDINQ